jgi:hypothetical protein
MGPTFGFLREFGGAHDLLTYVAYFHMVPLTLKNQFDKIIIDQHLNHMIGHIFNPWASLAQM